MRVLEYLLENAYDFLKKNFDERSILFEKPKNIIVKCKSRLESGKEFSLEKLQSSLVEAGRDSASRIN